MRFDSVSSGNPGALHTDEFTEFVGEVESRLRRALLARHGPDALDGLADAFAYAWEHWERVRKMENPAGYIYRIATNQSRRRRVRHVFPAPDSIEHDIEPGLPGALAMLSERQRVALLLIHGWDYAAQDVAELLGVSTSTVRNHAARGMRKLRKHLGVECQ
jgi:DNA-directed RNA polymerase specialized sigma24 family protein